MPGYYEAIDLFWTENGDISKGSDGDICSTEGDTLASFLNTIISVIRSNEGDFEYAANHCANLKDFIGEPNTRETAKKIEERIRTSLVLNNVVSASDFSIRTIPVSHDTLMSFISIAVTPSPTSLLSESGMISLSVVFDLVGGGILFQTQPKRANLFPVGE